MAASTVLTIAFYAVLGALAAGFGLRSWRRTARSRRAETPEDLNERLLREYERRPNDGRSPQWETGRERGGGAVSGCGGGCGGGG